MLSAPFLPSSFEQVAPQIAPWVDRVNTDPMAVALQNWIAQIEVFHFLGLFALGACVILTSLRLLGVGLIEGSPAYVYRQTRIWLHIGVAVALVSGVLLGLTSADKIYKSTAFLWKIAALLGAIVFSYGVMAPAAKAEGRLGPLATLGLLLGLALTGLALLIMLTNQGGNVAIIHLMFAGSLVAVAATAGRLRWAFLMVLGVLVLGLQVLTHAVFTDPFSEVYMRVNRIWMWITGLFILMVVSANVLGVGAAGESGRLARLVGYATILIWVTVGAGGRWIALS